MRLHLSISLLLVSLYSFGQGCSDAGFCTMGAMKPDQPFNKKIALKLRSMEVSFYRGSTTLTPIVYVATADMNFSLNRKTSFQLKVPFQHVEGRLGKTSSLSDLSICFTRNIYSSDKFDLNLSFGGKIPTNNSDFKDSEGNPLPMYYQTSLGTWDLISGISLINRHWLIATGIQVPLNENNNNFDWQKWDQSNPDEVAYVKEYPSATHLKRGIDVMLRIERNFRFSRFNCSVGLLPIYRITPDVYTSITGERISRRTQGLAPNVKQVGDRAVGLAMSWIVTAGYNFNVKSGVKLLVGHKITQREFSPDGLTRELVTSFTYIYRF